MERPGIFSGDFATNHSTGAFSRQLALTEADLMGAAPELEPFEPTAPLPEVINHLSHGNPSRGSLGATWVHIGSGDLSGLITDGDLR